MKEECYFSSHILSKDDQRSLWLSFTQEKQELSNGLKLFVSLANHYQSLVTPGVRAKANGMQRWSLKPSPQPAEPTKPVNYQPFHQIFRHAPVLYENVANMTALVKAFDEFIYLRTPEKASKTLEKRFGIGDVDMALLTDCQVAENWMRYGPSVGFVFSQCDNAWFAYAKKSDLSFLASDMVLPDQAAQEHRDAFEKIQIQPDSPFYRVLTQAKTWLLEKNRAEKSCQAEHQRGGQTPELLAARQALAACEAKKTPIITSLKALLAQHRPFHQMQILDAFKDRLLKTENHWHWIDRLAQSHRASLDKIEKSEEVIYLVRDSLQDRVLFSDADLIALVHVLHCPEIFELESYIQLSLTLNAQELYQLLGPSGQGDGLERHNIPAKLNTLTSPLHYIRQGVMRAFEARITPSIYQQQMNAHLIVFKSCGKPIYPKPKQLVTKADIFQGRTFDIMQSMPPGVKSLVNTLIHDHVFFKHLQCLVKTRPNTVKPRGKRRLSIITKPVLSANVFRDIPDEPQPNTRARSYSGDATSPRRSSIGQGFCTSPKRQHRRISSQCGLFLDHNLAALSEKPRRYSESDLPDTISECDVAVHVSSLRPSPLKAPSPPMQEASENKASPGDVPSQSAPPQAPNKRPIYALVLGTLALACFCLFLMDFGLTASLVLLASSFLCALLTTLCLIAPSMQTVEQVASALDMISVSPASTTSAQLSTNYDERDSIPMAAASASSPLSDDFADAVVARPIAFS